MKIILKKDFELLGEQGKVVEVKNGYARNYLIPNGIGALANQSNLKTFDEVKKQRARKVQKQTDEAKKTASELSNQTITITVKAGEDNKIFGSVTSQMIYDNLKSKGFEDIDRKKIILKEPIKTLGVHELEIKLQNAITATLKVNVVKEESESDKVPDAEPSEKPAENIAAPEKTEEPQAS